MFYVIKKMSKVDIYFMWLNFLVFYEISDMKLSKV